MAAVRARGEDTPARMLVRRLLWGAGAVAVVAYAIEGGEFGTSDTVSQHSRRDRLKSEVADLRGDVDSLRAEVKSVTTDNARLERMARERFGMVKGTKEVLYWTTRGNDASGNSVAPSRDAGGADSSARRDSSESVPRG